MTHILGGYSQSRCTPTRMSFMTGRYAWNFGFQADGVIETVGAAGIPLTETLLPEYLKQSGYDTHFYGKWHLGYCDEQLRPENRGFDTSYGFMGAGINYSTHTTSGVTKYADYWNQDTFEDSNSYTTDDFVDRATSMLDGRVSSGDSDPFFMWMSFNVPHSPVSAPTEAELNYFSQIEDEDRRIYLAALWRMDFQVGKLISKLKTAGEYENTIIIFQSDNGPTGAGSNFPLRGMKGTYAEGGQR